MTSTRLEKIQPYKLTYIRDHRGGFTEVFRTQDFMSVAQINTSFSHKHTLRGLHTQLFQNKIVWVTSGSIFDVIVDIRLGSPDFGKWKSFELEKNYLLLIPKGFAHGFYTRSSTATIVYFVDVTYDPKMEFTLDWSDREINISWPSSENNYLISEKDLQGMSLEKLKKVLSAYKRI